ncbi:unnamed protein product [Brassica napus]|uniref:(rape) hypothetical protein n=1 Tax=Brassica napus TaxID=3708 RepID=A0A816XPA9_BRANA|nr:unnamed protein product [Brassica napus]
MGSSATVVWFSSLPPEPPDPDLVVVFPINPPDPPPVLLVCPFLRQFSPSYTAPLNQKNRISYAMGSLLFNRLLAQASLPGTSMCYPRSLLCCIFRWLEFLPPELSTLA